MKLKFLLFLFFLATGFFSFSQDFLDADFHRSRRQALRDLMPENSVSVFFSNPVRNRSNDVDFVYHQDPNFYYLTGYREPHAVLLIFKEPQNINGEFTNEVLFVQERNEYAEMWTGKRLGVDGTKDQLGFKVVYKGKDFKNTAIDFSKFDKILFTRFENDVRDTRDNADLYDLMKTFQEKIAVNLPVSNNVTSDKIYNKKEEKIDNKSLLTYMGTLREVKTKEELVLLKKAVEISAVGQIEIMKAMHPGMSEFEVQGVHEFIYKKYGAEFEGYPSIVGAGNNGCILHYIENDKPFVGDKNLVLMDLGAEYHGYTADVTRTIPANGKFTKEQKLIYNLVYKAQEAGIEEIKVGASLNKSHAVTRKIINEGLAQLGIIPSEDSKHNYYPHGSSHHIGLDVHDLSNYGSLKENMIVTVEPGIYIPEGSNCDVKWWGIGIRIEDDILVTKEGPVNLSAKAPRKSDEIEELMKEKSVLNDFNLPELD